MCFLQKRTCGRTVERLGERWRRARHRPLPILHPKMARVMAGWCVEIRTVFTSTKPAPKGGWKANTAAAAPPPRDAPTSMRPVRVSAFRSPTASPHPLLRSHRHPAPPLFSSAALPMPHTMLMCAAVRNRNKGPSSTLQQGLTSTPRRLRRLHGSRGRGAPTRRYPPSQRSTHIHAPPLPEGKHFTRPRAMRCREETQCHAGEEEEEAEADRTQKWPLLGCRSCWGFAAKGTPARRYTDTHKHIKNRQARPCSQLVRLFSYPCLQLR